MGENEQKEQKLEFLNASRLHLIIGYDALKRKGLEIVKNRPQVNVLSKTMDVLSSDAAESARHRRTSQFSMFWPVLPV